MNSTTKAVRNLGKKSANVVKGTLDYGKSTIENTVIQGIIIIFLIVYSGILVKRMPLKFFAFFDNIIVKIVSLVIIALIGLFAPAVALFLAIALIVTLQVGQKRHLGDISSESSDKGSIESSIEKTWKGIEEGTEKGYDKLKGGIESGAHKLQQEYDVHIEGQNPNKVMENMQGYLDPTVGDYNAPAQTDNQAPLGYNNNSSCIGSCGGNNGDPSLSSQCGEVKTWNHQFSAQGFGGGESPVGFQASVGYPVV